MKHEYQATVLGIQFGYDKRPDFDCPGVLQTFRTGINIYDIEYYVKVQFDDGRQETHVSKIEIPEELCTGISINVCKECGRVKDQGILGTVIIEAGKQTRFIADGAEEVSELVE